MSGFAAPPRYSDRTFAPQAKHEVVLTTTVGSGLGAKSWASRNAVVARWSASVSSGRTYLWGPPARRRMRSGTALSFPNSGASRSYGFTR
jgi:hypothetical protein